MELASVLRLLLPKFAITVFCLYKLKGGPKQRRYNRPEETEAAFIKVKETVQELVTLRCMHA